MTDPTIPDRVDVGLHAFAIGIAALGLELIGALGFAALKLSGLM